MIEPELIEIIEGPTPDFHPSPQDWLQSIHEGPGVHEVAMTQLRTASGPDIIERCERAWDEGRPVRLDFPDELRMRQQVEVVALRLSEIDEGQLLSLWVSLPLELDLSIVEEIDEGDFDFDDDDFDFDDDDDFDDDMRFLG